jgi:hypothetical protein
MWRSVRLGWVRGPFERARADRQEAGGRATGGQELARHLGESHALGPVPLTSFGLFFGLYASLAAAFSPGVMPRSFLAACAFSIVAALTLCMLARYYLLPKVAPAARVWVVLGVFAAAGITRNVLLGLLCDALGMPVEQTSLATAAVSAMIVMSIATLTGGRLLEHRVAMTRLSERQAELLAMNNGFEDSVAEAHRELIDQVHGYLDPAVIELNGLLDAAEPASAEALTMVLTSTVTEIVRPLTDRLNAPPVPSTASAPLTPHAVVLFRLAKAQVNAPEAIQPNLIVVFTLLTLMIRSQIIPSGINNEALLVQMSGTFLMLALARGCWPRRFRVLGLPTAAAALAAVFGVAQIIPAGLTALLNPAASTLAAPNTLLSLAYWVVLGWAALTPALVSQLSAQAEQAASQVNTGLEVVEVCLRRQIWINRRNLTWVLHGPIQSALISSAMALGRGDDSVAVREQVRLNLRNALTRLDAERLAHPDLPAALAEIAAVWSVSCDVSFAIDTGALPLLAGDPDAATCITEIAREGVSNAVRHGGAARVSVLVDAPGHNPTGLVRVRVVSDGRGVSLDALSGLGSAMLDELTHTWSRRSEGLRTTLSASVPTRVP